jgi:hypothetical protein
MIKSRPKVNYQTLLNDKKAQRAIPGRNAPRHRRWVGRRGPNAFVAGQPQMPFDEEVTFVGSAKTLVQAREMKQDLQKNAKNGATFVIYHFVRLEKPFILWKDETVPTQNLSFGKIIGFDLFRVPEALNGNDDAIAEAIEEILKNFGQTGDATGVPPR